jgi:hypothetical protein
VAIWCGWRFSSGYSGWPWRFGGADVTLPHEMTNPAGSWLNRPAASCSVWVTLLKCVALFDTTLCTLSTSNDMVFAERLQGIESIHRIHAECFRGVDYLHRLVEEAQIPVNDAQRIGSASPIPLEEQT